MSLVKKIQAFWTASIRRQLVLGIITVHAVLMSIFVYDLVEQQSRFLHQQSIEQANSLAKTLASNSVSWIIANDVIGLEEVLESQRQYPDLQYAMVISPDGRVLSHTDISKTGLFLVDDESAKMLKGKVEQRLLIDYSRLVDVAAPIFSNDVLIGWARVGLGQEKNVSGLKTILRDGILYTLFAIVIGALFAVVMSKSITKGLKHLVDVADGIQKGQLNARSELKRVDELGHLSDDFNLMLDAIEKSKRDLQSLIDYSPAVIYAKDLDGRYIFINQKWAELFDADKKGIVGKTDHEIFEKAFADKFRENDLDVINAGHALDSEETAPHGDEIHTYVTVKFPLFDEQGKIYAVCGISTDITERKKIAQEKHSLEQQLFQSQKLQAIGQLTGGVAHDFNNMLAVILGFTELGLLKYGNSNDTLKNYLDEIYKAAQRGCELVNQMLIFSRKNQNEHIELESLNIVPMVKETVKMLQATFPANIKFELLVEPQQAYVVINPVMLSQIVMNLCINARDSMTNNGIITVTISQQTANQQECSSCHDSFNGEYVSLAIKDTGEGIDEETIKRIFDPFFSTKEVGKGTGMGLSVVHGIIHMLNGHMVVDSKVDKGTEFKVMLPLSDKRPIESVPIKANPHDLTGMKILVVDDEEAIIEYLEIILTTYGAEVTTFTDSQKALAFFKENTEKFDLVISDQTMPELLGTDMLREMLSLNENLACLLCTGYSESVKENTALAMGVKAFIMKPVNSSELLDTVSKYKP